MAQLTKIGLGSYGEVFHLDNDTVIKKCCLFDPSCKTETFEMSTFTELSILSRPGFKNIPVLFDVETTQSGRVKISMEHCGKTLLQTARELKPIERIQALPKVAFQLIEAALHLQENGVVHTDIKSANVMVTASGNIKLIDFGIVACETINKPDTNLMSKSGTIISHEWGTYTICPPETFTKNIWSVDKYMSWSIGITLCEFIFETHSFLNNFVLNSKEQSEYKKNYKNDWIIKQLLAKAFSKRMERQTLLVNLSHIEHLSKELASMLHKMLTLDYTKRASLLELFNLPVFNRYRKLPSYDGTVVPKYGLVPDIYCNKVEAPKSKIPCTKMRREVLECVFETYNRLNKTHLFTQAATLFDKYCAMATVSGDKYYLVASVCAYIVQHIAKMDSVKMTEFIEAFRMGKTYKGQKYTTDNLIECTQDVMFNTDFQMYSQTFDVIIAKSECDVNLVVVLQVVLDNPPPYHNAELIKRYVNAIKV